MEVKEGLVGPQNSSKVEKVVPVSRRREIGLPSIMAITLGSHEVMVFKPGSQWLKNGSPSLIRWRLVSRVERRESITVRRGFREGFGWFQDWFRS
jgi:hypothetical protein